MSIYGADLNIFAEIFKPILITGKKILGGDLGFLLAMPLSYVDLEIDAYDLKDDKFGQG
ncbi:MAG: transporter [Planctomycetes bacterium]|nr:transporter [Planctomycetota bacterium]